MIGNEVKNEIYDGQTGTITNLIGVNTLNRLRGTSSANITNFFNFKATSSISSTYTGAITNSYDFYTDDYSPVAGSITNKYGLYILGATKRNYLQGSVGIGTNSPTEKLEVAGAIKIGTTTTATPTAGTIRFNSTTSKFEGYDGTAWVPFH